MTKRAGEIWDDLEALAATVAGPRPPNRLILTDKLAREIEPDSDHPPHCGWESPAPGIWRVTRPDPQGWRYRHRLRRRCRQEKGGHFWHPVPSALVDWFCCFCGKPGEGMPINGTRGSVLDGWW
jgi:hypothetical protein